MQCAHVINRINEKKKEEKIHRKERFNEEMMNSLPVVSPWNAYSFILLLRCSGT